MKEENLRQALFYAWILDQVPLLPKRSHPNSQAKVIDLGSKNFVYVAALERFLSQHFQSFWLKGLEVDPYRIYEDLYRRGDYADYYLFILEPELREDCAIEYQAGDWLRWKNDEHYDLITCFFPFLFEDLHSRFGLLSKCFSPLKFYRKACEQADQVLFFHQGEEEKAESKRLLNEVGRGKIIFEQTFFGNPWMKRKFPVEAILWVAE